MRLNQVWCAGVVLTYLSLSDLEAQDRQVALLEADRLAAQLSSDSGFPTAMRRGLHQSGALLWPGAPVLLGPSEVNRFLSSKASFDSLRLTWQPLGVELSLDSTLGVLWGVVAAGRDSTPDVPRIGRYIAAWRRDNDRWTVAAVVLVGVSPSSPAPLDGPRATREDVRPSRETAPFIAADLAFARLAGESGAAVAFRTWADDDAVMFGGGGLLIRGPVAAGRAVSGPERWRWRPVAAGAAGSGDLGWTVGEAVIAGKEANSYSKYLTVWIQRGGVTRFLLDGGNPRPPTP